MKTSSVINAQIDMKEEATWGSFSESEKIDALEESFKIAIRNLEKAVIDLFQSKMGLQKRIKSYSDLLETNFSSFKQKALVAPQKMMELKMKLSTLHDDDERFNIQIEAVKLKSELDEEKANCEKLIKARPGIVREFERENETINERLKMIRHRIECMEEAGLILASAQKNDFLASLNDVIPASMSFKPEGEKTIWKDDKEIQLRPISYNDLLMKLASLVINHLDPLPFKLKLFDANSLRQTLKNEKLAELKINENRVSEEIDEAIDQAVEKEIADLSKPILSGRNNPAEAAAAANQAPFMRKR